MSDLLHALIPRLLSVGVRAWMRKDARGSYLNAAMPGCVLGVSIYERGGEFVVAMGPGARPVVLGRELGTVTTRVAYLCSTEGLAEMLARPDDGRNSA